jgi:hypothetical protein
MALAAASFGATAKTLPNGDQVQYDGTYYDFRAADAKAMVKLWVPPTANPVRGVFISGHGGGGGDSRDFARDENMKALAARYGFGLAGLHNFPGGQVYPVAGQGGGPRGEGGAAPAQPATPGGQRFFDAFNEFAALGIHPEIANIPFVFFGSSNGGSQAYGFASYAPERAICFVSNVSTPRSILNEAAMAVPGIFIVGRYDLLSREEAAVRRGCDTVLAARAKGARWGMIVEEKGHEDGVAFDVYIKMVEQCIALRYPVDQDPSKGPVKLTDLHEESGWLGDLKTDGDDVIQIAEFGKYTGDKAKASWLPNQEMAYVYRSAGTRNGPLVVGVDEVSRVYNPNTDPGTMFSIGGPFVDPGRKLKLVCDVRDMPDWSKIEFYNGSQKLGEATAPDKPELSVKVGRNDIVWCVSALGTSKSGKVGTSAPFYFTVRDTKIDLKSSAEKAPKPVWQDVVGVVGSKTALKPPANYQPKAGAVEKNVLLALGLTAEQEKTFDATPDRVAPFWADIDTSHSIVMLPATNAREGSAFSIVTSMDARLRIKAAHSARGLYLCFEANDNRFMNANLDPALYGKTDALDVLLDSHSSQWINDPANVLQAVNPGWGIFLTTKQYMVAYGNDAPPTQMKRLFPDPWDIVFNAMTTVADVRKRTGIQVRFTKINRLTRVQEWFIPWSELGRIGADTAEPELGTRFAFAPGYNDLDPGEPLGKELRWIAAATPPAPAAPAAAAPVGAPAAGGRGPSAPAKTFTTSPWANAAQGGTPPRGWGDIEVGPMIGQASAAKEATK